VNWFVHLIEEAFFYVYTTPSGVLKLQAQLQALPKA